MRVPRMFNLRMDPYERAEIVTCVKFRKLIMGSGKAIPSEPPSLASPRQGERGGGEGCGVHPLGGPERSSGGRLESLPLRIFQECHVEVAVILLPRLVLLDRTG